MRGENVLLVVGYGERSEGLVFFIGEDSCVDIGGKVPDDSLGAARD